MGGRGRGPHCLHGAPKSPHVVGPTPTQRCSPVGMKASSTGPYWENMPLRSSRVADQGRLPGRRSGCRQKYQTGHSCRPTPARARAGKTGAANRQGGWLARHGLMGRGDRPERQDTDRAEPPPCQTQPASENSPTYSLVVILVDVGGGGKQLEMKTRGRTVGDSGQNQPLRRLGGCVSVKH